MKGMYNEDEAATIYAFSENDLWSGQLQFNQELCPYETIYNSLTHLDTSAAVEVNHKHEAMLLQLISTGLTVEGNVQLSCCFLLYEALNNFV